MTEAYGLGALNAHVSRNRYFGKDAGDESSDIGLFYGPSYALGRLPRRPQHSHRVPWTFQAQLRNEQFEF